MKTKKLLSRIHDLGIQLWMDGDDLRYSAPKGVLTPDLRAELAERKAEILALLRETQAIVPPFQSGESNLEPRQTFTMPRTTIEETLVAIWAQVLDVERVGIHDNFFNLGGDSILILQVIHGAKQAGLRLTPPQILRHQTIAELAAVEGTAQMAQAEQGIVTGPLPLTFCQHWCLEVLPGRRDPQHWNLARLLEIEPNLDGFLLWKAAEHLLAHHDGLRTRFVCEASGWRQFIARPDGTTPFMHIDLSELSESDQKNAIESQTRKVQKNLDLSTSLIRFVLFDLGATRRGRLFILAHHLIIDGVSMTILLQDLETACRQLLQEKEIRLPDKTTSIKQWAERLARYARSAELGQELDYWLAQPWAQAPHLPVDYPAGKEYNTLDSVQHVLVSLSVEESQVLLRDVPRTYNTQVANVLLMALVQTMTRWTGGRWLEVTVVFQGRDIIPGAGDIDLSRTVGWFGTGGVFILERTETDDLVEALKSVEAQLRRIPNRGCGYNLLASLRGDAEITKKLRPLRKDEVNFNYAGQVREENNEFSLFKPAQESTGPKRNLRNKMFVLLGINGFILENQLTMDWYFSANVYKQSTIETLAQDFIKTLQQFVALYLA